MARPSRAEIEHAIVPIHLALTVPQKDLQPREHAREPDLIVRRMVRDGGRDLVREVGGIVMLAEDLRGHVAAGEMDLVGPGLAR